MRTNKFYTGIFFALMMAVYLWPVVLKAAGDEYEPIFLRVSVPRTQVYLGERIPITISLYVTELNVTQVYPPLLEQPEFSFEETVRSSQSSEELDGRSYHVVRFFTAGTPLVAGNVALKPVTVQCSVSQSQNDQGLIVNPSRYEVIRGALEVDSSPVRFRVNPLPETGRPADFSGGVGQFEVRCRTATTDIREGEPFTVGLIVSGTGNFQSIDPPVLAKADGFKIFPARRQSMAGGKVVFEQTVVPLDSSLRRLGPYRLSYFNPNTGKYETAMANLPLRIKAVPEFSPTQAEFIGEDRQDDGERLAGIKESSTGLEPVQPWLITRTWFWWVQSLPLAGLLTAFGFRRYRRCRTDNPRIREKEAAHLALERLAATRIGIANQEYDRVLNELYGLLREYLAVKWGREAADLAETADWDARDFAPGLAPDVWRELQSFLAGYHQCRFAGAKLDAGQMTALFEKVQGIISALNQMAPISRPIKDEKKPQDIKEVGS